MPFPRQAGGKGNRKRTRCAHDPLFLDRQEGNELHEDLLGPPTGFRNGYWASPPAGGLALPERFRRRRNRSAFGDSAEGGIALLLPPCGRLTYKSRCAQCKYELTGMNKLGYANAGGRSAGMREAHSGYPGVVLGPSEPHFGTPRASFTYVPTFPEPLFSLLFSLLFLFSCICYYFHPLFSLLCALVSLLFSLFSSVFPAARRLSRSELGSAAPLHAVAAR